VLQGVVPFPPEFARRYRERGYWQDKSLAEEFKVVFDRYRGRVAVIDRDRSFTYDEIDRLSSNLALNLLGAGLKPLDRVVVQLPNVAEFIILYFALQKMGGIPIAARLWERLERKRSHGASACGCC
jgi:2,3-dihydroxybenzoate-AMP ligase